MTTTSTATEYTKDQTGYSQGSLFVTPHFTDSQLATLFVEFQATGIDREIWYQDPPNLRWFLDYSFNKPGLITLVAYVQNLDGDMALAGISWIDPPILLGNGFKKTEIGFGFLRHISTWDKVKLGRMMIDWVRDNTDINFLFGFTPIENEPALAFSRRLGFEQSEPIKNYLTWNGRPSSVIISQMELHGEK